MKRSSLPKCLALACAFVLFSGFTMPSCKKNGDSSPPQSGSSSSSSGQTEASSSGSSSGGNSGGGGVSTPTITSVTPTFGAPAGGQTVTLAGDYFEAGLTVSINGVACATTTYSGSTSATCVTPAASAGGPYTVSVTNPDQGTGSLPNAYAYAYSMISADVNGTLENFYGFDSGDCQTNSNNGSPMITAMGYLGSEYAARG